MMFDGRTLSYLPDDFILLSIAKVRSKDYRPACACPTIWC
jgi:hypothetical protein